MPKKRLVTPLKEEEILDLRLGDIVYLKGDVYTARDKAHQRIIDYLSTGAETEIPIEKGAVLFHCGPLVRKNIENWKIIAAGPTTSSRMEGMTTAVLEKLRVRAIIGKGGMGSATREAMRRYRCVYLALTGGAAVLAATGIQEIKAVYWADLGMAEAVWHLLVENFGPLVLSIDARGRSLYEDINEDAERKVRSFLINRY